MTLHDRLHDYAMLAVQGPDARGSSRASPMASCPSASGPPTLTVAGAPERPRVRHRLHRRGRRRVARRARATRQRSGTRSSQAGAQPAGLGARDTLRLEVCFHLYGNDLMETRGPIEAGLGWCVKEDTGFIGAEAIKVARENGPSEQLVPFVLTGPGIARQGNADPRRRRGHLRHAQPIARHGHRHGLRPGRQGRAGHRRSRSTSAARRAPPRSATKPLYTARRTDRGRGQLPRRPQVPRRARLGAHRRRHRDAGHHLVRPGPARRGRVLRPAGGRHDDHQGLAVRRGRVREGGRRT